MKHSTDFSVSAANTAQALLAAALVLPLTTGLVHAESAPERASVAYNYLDYLDSQPDADRVGVKAHTVQWNIPVNEQWALTATVINDTVSGASPAQHSVNLSELKDYRQGRTIAATRYLTDGTVAVSLSRSKESDYLSRSASVTWNYYTDSNKNTMLSAGIGKTRDDIAIDHGAQPDQHKQIDELLLGVTQVLTQNDIMQFNLRGSWGNGYYTDPYKVWDQRPSKRNAATFLTRWNHHIDDWGSTFRGSYRYYNDSFSIRSHTVELNCTQPLGQGWSVEPLLRWYQQSAASFYVPYNPSPDSFDGSTIPQNIELVGAYFSEDQRLSAFGALTTGLTVRKEITPDLVLSFKLENYQQHTGWAKGGDPGLLPFKFHSIQMGMNYRF